MAVLVGKKAPDFTASAVINGEEIVENFKLSDYAGKYVILFFYPKDFTFVCPTELHAFQARKEEFAAKGVELIAVSTDTEQSHWGWLQMSKDHGGIEGVTYPIIYYGEWSRGFSFVKSPLLACLVLWDFGEANHVCDVEVPLLFSL